MPPKPRGVAMHKRVGPNSAQSEPVGVTSRPEEGLHLRLDKLHSDIANVLYGVHASLIALNRIGTTLVESVDAAEDGLAIERLAGDSKNAVESLIGFIDDTLRPIIKEASHG